MSDFNAFGSSPFNSFLDSGFDARGRLVPFTLRFWFRWETLGAYSLIPFSTPTGVGSSWFVQIESGNIHINSQLFAAHPTVLLNASDWNYFAGGYDGERLFARLNGSALFHSLPFAMASKRGFQLNLTWFVNVGSTPPNPSLDEVALWKDRALDSGEIDADYNAGAGLDFAGVDRDGLLAYWELEGTNGVEPVALVDSLNGYALARVDGSPSHHPIYDTGKFGNGLHYTGGSGGAGAFTHFSSNDPVFTFGED